MDFVFRIQNKSRNTRRDSRKDIERFWLLEKKRSGMETFPYTPEGKWDSTATQMVERSKDTSHPVSVSTKQFPNWCEQVGLAEEEKGQEKHIESV